MSKKNISIVLNILIVVLEIIGIIYTLSSYKLNLFMYYTIDSNILLLFASILYLIGLFTGKNNKFVHLLKFSATVSVAITFIVVLSILSWSSSLSLYNLLVKDAMLYHHILCPLLAITSFILFEKYDNKMNRYQLKGLLFTVLYAVVIIFLNIFKIISGPYPFLMVYNQSIIASIIWFILMACITYIVSLTIKILSEKYNN